MSRNPVVLARSAGTHCPANLLLSLALLLACIDGGVRTYDDAKLEYVHLVDQGKLPQDPAFDAVMEKLKRVPTSSAKYTEAQRLVSAIEAGRVRVRPPLAVAPSPKAGESAEMLEQRRACARLAELAGLDGGASGRALVALDDCQKRIADLEKREEAQAHP